MRWADQLIKLSNFELEELQPRLSQAVTRREACELKLLMLTAQGEAELELARRDPEAGWRIGPFREALKLRKVTAQRDIELARAEEEGARDAIAEAFERLKKYEQVAESAKAAEVREEARREAAVLDEMGLRRAAGRR
ncbi:MAG TPA: flagellar FliJ family protein [Caulobacteraceae bacterium]|jgi:flagellar FliJ protein